MLVSLGMLSQRMICFEVIVLTIAYIERNVCMMVSITLCSVERSPFFMIHNYSVSFDVRDSL